MSMLKDAPEAEVQRLLNLFPMKILKAHWPEHKSLNKDELCAAVAKQRNVGSITEFLTEHVSCCRQHVYICKTGIPHSSAPSLQFPSGARIWEDDSQKDERQSLHLIRVGFKVSLVDPPAEDVLYFLWPIWLTWRKDYLILRCVTLEPKVKAHFEGRDAIERSRSCDEPEVLKTIAKELDKPIRTTDLHKGAKKLWATDFMDAVRVKYKKAHSTATEVMDEKKGIKKSDPDLYAALQKEVLINVLFELPEQEKFSVSAVIIEPPEGHLVFPRFSDNPGDTDHVVREILRFN